MQIINVQSTAREVNGKSGARAARRAGKIPAVVYGHGVETPIPVNLDPKVLDETLKSPFKLNTLIELAVGEQSYKVFVRQIQRHAVSRAIVHVDLVAPNLDSNVVALVPVAPIGKAKGVTTGGKLRIPYREIKVQGKPMDIPATVEVDVTHLDHAQGILASEMKLPGDLKIIYDSDFLVVKVQPPRGGKGQQAEKA
ncbi:50S ribosomal protein L25 [Myxococcota bacterium]|nr:50S ribosomal protein L25 [Myxococcota bacterium]MBU1431378.1 50S ribosomal protein L25 [Myxococcota bacterium]MBU1896964.1 50S ribosomal protein L25 [Myxococcota bacterium]